MYNPVMSQDQFLKKITQLLQSDACDEVKYTTFAIVWWTNIDKLKDMDEEIKEGMRRVVDKSRTLKGVLNEDGTLKAKHKESVLNWLVELFGFSHEQAKSRLAYKRQDARCVGDKAENELLRHRYESTPLTTYRVAL